MIAIRRPVRMYRPLRFPSRAWRRLATRTMRIAGWRRPALALVLGVLATLSLAPFGQWWVLFVTMPPLAWLLAGAARRGDGRRRAAAGATVLGAFGLGWFAASVWWVGEAFLVEAERFAAVMPVAVVALAAFLALFWAATGALVAVLWRDCAALRLPPSLLLASAWTLAEFVRGRFAFGGFPWNLPAHGMATAPLLDQTAALFGLYGLSFLTVLWATAPAWLSRPMSRRGAALSLAFVTLVAALVWGGYRLNVAPPIPPMDERKGLLRVRIVQPAVAQRDKWKPQNRAAIFRALLDLSASDPQKGQLPDVIVWPESAVPFLLDEDPAALAAIARLLRPGQMLITGALRRAARSGPDARRLANAVFAIDDAGRIVGRYDKRRLVPFGEYLPLKSLLEPLGIRRLVPLPRGFVGGPADQRPLPDGRVGGAGALVCYEAIFPELSRSWRRAGARWLVNVTNDAWFGTSIGPHQHLAAARLRAIETGLPLVRAANTGISAAFDGYGRPLARLGLIRRGVLDITLPHPASPPLSTLSGSLPVLLLSLTLVMPLLVYNLRKAKGWSRLRKNRP